MAVGAINNIANIFMGGSSGGGAITGGGGTSPGIDATPPDRNLNKATKGYNDLNSAVNRTHLTLQRFGIVARRVAYALLAFKVLDVITQAFSRLTNEMFRGNMQMEVLTARLTQFLGSQRRSAQAIRFITAEAITTPFEIPNLIEASATLKTFQISIKDYIRVAADTTAANANISNSIKDMGVQLVETATKMGRVALGITGWRRSLLSMRGDVTEFDKVLAQTGDRLKALDAALAKFKGFSETLSATTIGRWSNINDIIGIMARRFGSLTFTEIQKDVKNLFDSLNNARTDRLDLLSSLMRDMYITFREVTQAAMSLAPHLGTVVKMLISLAISKGAMAALRLLATVLKGVTGILSLAGAAAVYFGIEMDLLGTRSKKTTDLIKESTDILNKLDAASRKGANGVKKFYDSLDLVAQTNLEVTLRATLTRLLDLKGEMEDLGPGLTSAYALDPEKSLIGGFSVGAFGQVTTQNRLGEYLLKQIFPALDDVEQHARDTASAYIKRLELTMLKFMPDSPDKKFFKRHGMSPYDYWQKELDKLPEIPDLKFSGVGQQIDEFITRQTRGAFTTLKEFLNYIGRLEQRLDEISKFSDDSFQDFSKSFNKINADLKRTNINYKDISGAIKDLYEVQTKYNTAIDDTGVLSNLMAQYWKVSANELKSLKNGFGEGQQAIDRFYLSIISTLSGKVKNIMTTLPKEIRENIEKQFALIDKQLINIASQSEEVQQAVYASLNAQLSALGISVDELGNRSYKTGKITDKTVNELRKLINMIQGLVELQDKIQFNNWQEQARKLVSTMESILSPITNIWSTILEGTKNWGEVMRSTLKQMIAQILALLTRTLLLMSIFKILGSKFLNPFGLAGGGFMDIFGYLTGFGALGGGKYNTGAGQNLGVINSGLTQRPNMAPASTGRNGMAIDLTGSQPIVVTIDNREVARAVHNYNKRVLR